MKVQDKAALAELKIELDKLRREYQHTKQELALMQENTDASIQDRDRVIKHKTDQIQELVQDKRSLEETLDEEQQHWSRNLEEVHRVSEEEFAKKDSEIKALREELEKYEQYKALKEEHDQETAVLREQLDTLAESHQKKVQELEQKVRMETERAKLWQRQATVP